MAYRPSVRSRWLDIKFFFCVFMDQDEVEVHKQEKNEANIQPSWSNKLGQ